MVNYFKVEAFWCFNNYLEKIKEDFLEEGMVKKIGRFVEIFKQVLATLFTFKVTTDPFRGTLIKVI